MVKEDNVIKSKIALLKSILEILREIEFQVTKSIVDVKRGQIFQIAKLVDESVVHATRQGCRLWPLVGQIVANRFDAIEMTLVDGVSHVSTAIGRIANAIRIIWRIDIVSNILLILAEDRCGVTIVAQHCVMAFPQDVR